MTTFDRIRQLVHPLTCTIAFGSIFTVIASCSSSHASQGTAGAVGIESAAQIAPPGAEGSKSSDREISSDEQAHGRVVDGPTNLRTFNPPETNGDAAIKSSQVNLRKVFEDLGSDATLWYQHVQTLANPFFGGREPGTKGDRLAVEYIEFYFQEYGLKPAFSANGNESLAEGSFRQSFDFASPNPEITVLKAAASINGEALEDQKDFTLLGNTGNGEVAAPVTFVGYGIAEGPDGYSSFEGETDLTGRIAMVLRYEPLNEEGKSRWSQARFSRNAGIAPKVAALAERGAAGIILVNPPGAVDGKKELDTLADSSRFGRRMSVPVVQITPQAAEILIAAGDPEKRDLLALRKLADNGEIKSIEFSDSLQVSLTSSINAKDRLDTFNVAAMLPGKGELANQWIVIGGHYDHIGHGYTGSRTRSTDLHPGADDNASGIAAMLISAKRLSEHYATATKDANLRSILFVAFGAEEAGLHGSRYITEHPPIPLEQTSIMFNMDMVGRLRSNNLLMQGTGTAEGMEEMIEPIIEQSGLKVSAMPGGRGPSDHSNFYAKDIPVLFLFTGEHEDYHSPTDHAHTVNPAGAVKIIDLLEDLVLHIAAMPEKLQFKSSAGGVGGRDTGARVSLGTIPDYTAELETGMRVEDVRDGSSAAEAGIKGGDILLTWNGEEIAGARKLGELLSKHEPGDMVRIVLLRGEEEVTVNVTLQARAAQ